MVKRNRLTRIVAGVALPVIMGGCAQPGTHEYARGLHHLELTETIKQIKQGKQFSQEEQADPIYQEAQEVIIKSPRSFFGGEIGGAILDALDPLKIPKSKVMKDSIYLKNGEILEGRILGINTDYIYIAVGRKDKAIHRDEISSYVDNAMQVKSH